MKFDDQENGMKIYGILQSLKFTDSLIVSVLNLWRYLAEICLER